MRVRVKHRQKKFAMRECGCCESVCYKEKVLDQQMLKEALDDIYGDCSVMGTREAVNFAYRDRNPLSPQMMDAS